MLSCKHAVLNVAIILSQPNICYFTPLGHVVFFVIYSRRWSSEISVKAPSYKRWRTPVSRRALPLYIPAQDLNTVYFIITIICGQQCSHSVAVICRPWKRAVVRMLGAVLALINVLPCRWSDCFQCGVVLLLHATKHAYTIYIYISIYININ